MRIEASHRDGFTEHLLNWELVADGDVATVRASWLGNRDNPVRFQIPIDTAQIRSALPQLLRLKEEYASDVTDMAEINVRIVADDVEWSCSVYALGFVVAEHPEIEPFVRIWWPINEAVERHLALPGRRSDSRTADAFIQSCREWQERELNEVCPDKPRRCGQRMELFSVRWTLAWLTIIAAVAAVLRTVWSD